MRAVDRGQALGYARALWARAWARSLISQALTPSLSASTSRRTRSLKPILTGRNKVIFLLYNGRNHYSPFVNFDGGDAYGRRTSG